MHISRWQSFRCRRTWKAPSVQPRAKTSEPEAIALFCIIVTYCDSKAAIPPHNIEYVLLSC